MTVPTIIATVLAALIAAFHAGVRASLAKLWTTALVTVNDVKRTYVDAIKEASADGELTDAEEAHARDLALAKLKGDAGPTAMLFFYAAIGHARGDRLLAGMVEAAVQAIKVPPPARETPAKTEVVVVPVPAAAELALPPPVEKGTAAPGALAILAMVGGLLLLAQGWGCTWLHTNGGHVQDVAVDCSAPAVKAAAADILADVIALVSGQSVDYVAQLDALVSKYRPDAVFCAVREATARPGAAPGTATRGGEYLKAHHVRFAPAPNAPVTK